MKKFLLLVVVLFTISSIKANHLAGGYISYTHVSGNTYEVVIDMYRDCNGGGPNLPGSYTAYVFNASGSQVTTVLLNSWGPLTQVPGTSDPCVQVPSTYCLQKQTYKGTTTLSNSTGGYTISINDYARNPGIVNIVSPTSASFLIFAKIPNPGSVANNSGPIFVNPPPPVICVNRPMYFDYSATDPDGDQLVYSLCTAYSRGAAGAPGPPPYNPITYNAGFAPTNPMTASPPVSINSNTGLLTGVPTATGKYVVVICVKEYRNGVLIGEYFRDAQFEVSQCTQSITAATPGSSPIAGGGTPRLLCKNSYNLTFTNNSTGTTNYHWDFGVSGITNDTSNLSTPTYTYPDTGTYIVRLIAGPGQQCADTTYLTVKVYPGLKVGYTYAGVLCTGNPVQFTDTSSTPFGTIMSRNWSFDFGLPGSTQQNPVTVFNVPFAHNVKLVVQDSKGCKDSVTKTILINQSPSLNAGADKDICIGGSTTIGVSSTAPVSWSPATGLSCTSCTTPTANPTATTTYIATATGSNGCTIKDTVVVTVHPTPTVNAGPDLIVCNSGSVQINGSVSNITGTQTVLWTPSSGLSSTSILNPISTPVATTTYVLKVTNAAGCFSTDTVTVYKNVVSVNAGPNVAVCIGDSAQLNATSPVVTGTFSWTPVTGLSNPNIKNPKASPTSTTIYTVTVTDTAGCTASSSVTVTINTNNNVDAGLDKEICHGGSVTLTATGGVSYIWDSHSSLSTTAGATTTASPTVTTTYYVTGTSTVGCDGRDSVKVTVLPLPVFSVSGNNNICEGASTILTASSATSGLSYSWTPATGLSCTNCPNPTANPTTTTTYTVTATDNKGCSDTRTITINVNPKPNVDAGNPFVGLCTGFSKTLTATGADSYTWSPATGLSCTNCPNPTASPTTTITYTVVGVNNTTGCTSQDTVRIEVQPTLPINISQNDSICINGSKQLFAYGGDSYAWSPPTGLNSTNINTPVASPTVTTVYTVTVSDLNGCTNSGTVNIKVNPLPVVSASATSPVICEGLSTNLQASGGVSYSWTPVASLDNPNIANPKASPTANTTYTVVATDNKGCTNSATVAVSVNPKPSINAGPATVDICINDSVKLSATGGTSYTWTPSTGLSATNVSDPWAFPSSTTKYYVTGTDANGCQNLDSITVVVKPLPTITFSSPRELCFGESLQVTASGANTYSWTPTGSVSNPNIANPSVSPTSTTTYTVTGSDGCTNTATVTITVNPLPTVVVSAPATICEGASTVITASGGSTYAWTPTTGLSCTSCPNPTASPLSTTTYTVNVTDIKGCKNSASVTVSVNPKPSVSAGSNFTICVGDSTQLQASGAVSYSWAPAATLDDPLKANPVAKPAATTIYTVTGTDANGCQNTSTVTVTVNTLPVVNINPPTPAICAGSSTQLTASGGNTYTWSPATGLSNPNIADPIANPDTTTMYTVEVSNGCVVKDSVLLTVNPNPVVQVSLNASASQDTTVCLYEPIQLNATGAATYAWTPATDLSCYNCDNPIATPLTTTTYIVTGTDINGCTGADTVTININMPALPNAQPKDQNPPFDYAICIGDTVALSAFNGTSYEWIPAAVLDDSASANPIAVPVTTTDFIVKIVDTNGCYNFDTVSVKVNPLPQISAGSDISIYFGEYANLNATGGVTYSWQPMEFLNNPDIANPTGFPQDTTVFIVTSVDINGCINSDTVIVNVLGQSQVIFPTAFSPNGDGVNDLFKIGFKENFNLLSIRIYNRWGILVFSTNNINEAWDGKYQGQDMPLGTYIYLIEGEDDLGKYVRKSGNITIIR